MSPSLCITSDPSLPDSSPAVIVRVERCGRKKITDVGFDILVMIKENYFSSSGQDLIYKSSSEVDFVAFKSNRRDLLMLYRRGTRKRKEHSDFVKI